MSAKRELTATPSQTIGPFFHYGLAERDTVRPDDSDIRLLCRVRDGDNRLVCDAMIELWQADREGRFGDGFARLFTDQEGSCTFKTFIPGSVSGQAPHINVSLFARGLLNRLVTRIYFAGHPANESDQVLALVPAERRGTVMAYADAADPSLWTFEVRMCSDCETVFFDV